MEIDVCMPDGLDVISIYLWPCGIQFPLPGTQVLSIVIGRGNNRPYCGNISLDAVGVFWEIINGLDAVEREWFMNMIMI